MIIAWIEFIILIVKIVILSAIYSCTFLPILILLFKGSKSNFGQKTSTLKIKLWLFLHFSISIVLFQYRFSYSRDTGFGENSIIPIGYQQKIENADGEITYFFPDLKKNENNKDEIYLENFIICNEKICAEISNKNSNKADYRYIIYDLKSKTFKTFNNESDYKIYAQENNLPKIGEFYSFQKHYYEYIESIPKWKKWLLP